MKRKIYLFGLLFIALSALWLVGCDKDQSSIVSPGIGDDVQELQSGSIDLSVEKVNAVAKQQYEEMLANGFVAKPEEGGDKSMCIYLYVPHYLQTDSRWKNHSLGFDYNNDSTIGQYGCHLTCIAMLYKRWGYSNITPLSLNNWSCSGRKYYAFSTSRDGDLIRLPEALQYPYMSRPYRSISYSQILGELIAGRPVVAHIKWSGVSSHFVVIYAFDGSRFWVKDPLGGSKPLYGQAHSSSPYRVYGF